MGKYAERTKVPVARSVEQIQRALKRYGADGFQYAEEGARAGIGFKAAGRLVRMTVDLPDDDQGQRQRWRAMLLVVGAKLESIETGIETFEEAFLAHIVVPGEEGSTTLGKILIPNLPRLIERGELPKLLE